MLFKTLTKLLSPKLTKKCHSVFNFKELIQQEKTNFKFHPVTSNHREMVLGVVKEHFLREHAFVRARSIDLNDRALDEYLVNLLKQGNTLYATTDNGEVAGVCVNFASSSDDPKNLRHYAYYRQDKNVKDFLCFTAKLQETPNLWEAFNQPKIFEIKMLTVLPEFRRQGLAVALVEKSKEQALNQGYKVIRMDCINPFDYKVAERCMLQCILRCPLHKLRDPHAPYIKRSQLSRLMRVYVTARVGSTPERDVIKQRQQDFESLME